MNSNELWAQYQQGGWKACDPTRAQTAGELHYASVLAASAQDWESAARLAGRAAAAEPHSLLLSEAARYLQRRSDGQRDVAYAEGDTADGPAAFSAFVRGGGNVPLYDAVSTALRREHGRLAAALGRPIELLDIGVGDGRALLPALSADVAGLHLVEPSANMLATCVEALKSLGRTATARVDTAQTFLASNREKWDLVEATFSLQSIAPAERVDAFARLRGRCRRLLVVEFDVREFAHDLAPERVLHFRECFEAGLIEYTEPERDLIARGFLMPVYFGYFDPGAERVNHEHSLRTWVAQLQRAGFDQVRCHVVYRYWWAPAYLIDAA
ncbi:MAG: class I SAM-dependent methyltransferase [Anaerolineales bacterium]|nr:class I SAM-dependent methyltransferase [Anaerolineales bacterium]